MRNENLSPKLKAAVRKVDGNQCVLDWTYGTVGTHNRLAVHHFGRESYQKPSIENCVTLCASCHGKVTTNPQSPLAILLKIVIEVRKRYLQSVGGIQVDGGQGD